MTPPDSAATVGVPADLWRAITDHLTRAPYCDMQPTINPHAALPADQDPAYWRAACEATRNQGVRLLRAAAEAGLRLG